MEKRMERFELWVAMGGNGGSYLNPQSLRHWAMRSG